MHKDQIENKGKKPGRLFLTAYRNWDLMSSRIMLKTQGISWFWRIWKNLGSTHPSVQTNKCILNTDQIGSGSKLYNLSSTPLTIGLWSQIIQTRAWLSFHQKHKKCTTYEHINVPDGPTTKEHEND